MKHYIWCSAQTLPHKNCATLNCIAIFSLVSIGKHKCNSWNRRTKMLAVLSLVVVAVMLVGCRNVNVLCSTIVNVKITSHHRYVC